MAVKVRKATTGDAAAIAHVHVDTWRTTYRGLMSDEFLSSLSYDRRQRMWEGVIRDPDHKETLLVAEDDTGHIIGFADCGTPRDEKEFDGELHAIYVIQSSQGKGVGRELVRAVVNDLKARGLNSMLVWVLADNPFKRFYESLGGEHLRTRNVDFGGMVLKELGYGWRSLESVKC